MKLIDKINLIHLSGDPIRNYGPQRLVMEALNLTLTQLYELHMRSINDEQIAAIDRAVEAVRQNIPLARIFNRQYFCKNLFYVSPYTLDPRPETELLVEYVIDNLGHNFGNNLINNLKNNLEDNKSLQVNSNSTHSDPIRSDSMSMLDIGTGTGCILLSLLRAFPHCSGTGIDISSKAIETAKHNADLMKINATFFVSNWYDEVKGHFDLIISNPPYVRTTCSYEARFDPPIALWDRDDSYSKIITRRYLNPNGIILLEAPSYALAHITNLAEQNEMKVQHFSLEQQIISLEQQYLSLEDGVIGCKLTSPPLIYR